MSRDGRQLPAGTTTLGFQARWNIEDCGPDPCDYAYVEVDDGTGWKAIAGTIANPAEGNGIDGSTTAWVPATFDLSAYAGKTVGLRVRYVDRRRRPGQPGRRPRRRASSSTRSPSPTVRPTVFSDGAETGPNGWTLDGFASIGRDDRRRCYDNYYIAGSPVLRLVRQVPQDRPVLLRLPQHEAGLGRPLRVPAGSADLLLGHVAGRQQRQ